VQLDLPFLLTDAPPDLKLQFVRVARARKYILRVRPDGTLRVTIPRGGSRREAEVFLEKHRLWAEQERARVAAQHAPVEWRAGDRIMLGGHEVVLRVERGRHGCTLIVGDQRVRMRAEPANLRPAAEAALRQIAIREVIPRLHQLARGHGLTISRAIVRNQSSRWGSCSRAGVIALNFRLVQMPSWVCDYVLIHELMHLRQHNHSRRYWRLVEDAFPAYREAERWLRVEGRSLF
jgi:predicted metal-dependent hydrolase